MAFRGGRGFGRGGGGYRPYFKPQKFELFPGLQQKEEELNANSRKEIPDATGKQKVSNASHVELENFPDANCVCVETALIIWRFRLQSFWSSSAYNLDDKGPKIWITEEDCTDIERFSDRGKKRTRQKDKLLDFIKCSSEYVPAELAQDSKSERYGRKKVRWNQDSDLQKFDLFEKLEQKEGQGEKDGKGKQEGENEDEEDEGIAEDEEEFCSDDDYNQNIDFDDDEDDYNMADDNEDEGIF